MKKRVKNIVNIIVTFLVIFAILFTMSTIIFVPILKYVYESINFLRELIVVCVISLLMSILLTCFLQINRISVLLQTILIYCFIFMVIFLSGYKLYIYDFYNNSRLFIATIIFFITGLIIIITIQLIISKKNDDSLNEGLKHFKERDK